MKPHDIVTLDAITEARKRISQDITRTPLVRYNNDSSKRNIFLKLENLQPMNSFKVRGAGNKILKASESDRAEGVWTASAGNMALAVGWFARKLKIPCTVFVSELVPESKLARLYKMGCIIKKIPFADWFSIILTHEYPGMKGIFVHPVSDSDVMAGNGTIGLEILEDCPDVDSIIMPFGLGGLSCGVSSAIKALKPNTQLIACETEAAAPFATSLAAGESSEVPYNPSFADAMGTPILLPEMWPLAKKLLDRSIVCSLNDIAQSVKLLAENSKVIAEGSGAVSLAAALSGKADKDQSKTENIVCIISGGNIDTSKLITALNNGIPK